MPPLFSEGYPAVLELRETHAHFRHPLDSFGALADDGPDDIRIAEPVARLQCVGDMALEVVGARSHAGEPPCA